MITRKVNTTNPPKIPNGLTMGYRAIHGCNPPVLQQGLTAAPKKTWNGIKNIDGNLRDEWLEEINSIEGIEILSTEEGENAYRPAHVVFQFTSEIDDYKAAGICNFIKEFTDVYSYWDMGNKMRARIVFAGDVLSLTDEWERWWSTIGDKIKWALEGSL